MSEYLLKLKLITAQKELAKASDQKLIELGYEQYLEGEENAGSEAQVDPKSQK